MKNGGGGEAKMRIAEMVSEHSFQVYNQTPPTHFTPGSLCSSYRYLSVYLSNILSISCFVYLSEPILISFSLSFSIPTILV